MSQVCQLNVFHGDFVILNYDSKGVYGHLGVRDQIMASLDQSIIINQAILYQNKEKQNLFNNCVFQILLEEEEAPKNTPIKFGSVVKFKHVSSGNYLTTKEEFFSQTHYFVISVSEKQQKNQSFIVHSKFKIKQETEHIQSGDTICIQSFVTKAYVSVQSLQTNTQEKQDFLQQNLYNAVVMNKKQGWKIFLSYRPSIEKLFINGGDFIRLFHVEVGGNISAR